MMFEASAWQCIPRSYNPVESKQQQPCQKYGCSANFTHQRFGCGCRDRKQQQMPMVTGQGWGPCRPRNPTSSWHPSRASPQASLCHRVAHASILAGCLKPVKLLVKQVFLQYRVSKSLVPEFFVCALRRASLQSI